MIEVKIRDKVICWLAIIVFTFFALISLLTISPSESSFFTFYLVGFIPLVMWLVLGTLARNGLSFLAPSLYICFLLL